MLIFFSHFISEGQLPASPIEHGSLIQDSFEADEKSTPGSPANQNISAQSGSVSEPTSTASVSPQELHQAPYDNQAFQSERATISQSETEQLSMSERLSTTDVSIVTCIQLNLFVKSRSVCPMETYTRHHKTFYNKPTRDLRQLQ